ncbi:xre family toxin-antitoxin system, antitoxin component [Streptomyces sp. SPB074]|nr:xre family toxin-antitoxin system, antitoxin component [Streptomyces sp. SPB074]
MPNVTAETDAPDAASSLLAFFGTELSRLRSERGMSQGKLAKAAYTTQAMISYVENAERVPSPELAQNLDTALETAGHFTRLYPLVVRYAYPTWFLPFIELERDATTMRVFEAQIIPGLLQTKDYARAMLSAVRPDNLSDLVAARMSRQELFEREVTPRMWFIMDEQVLQRPIGGDDVWRAQLGHLLRRAESPRTLVQVIPRKVVAHAGLAGPFTLLTFEKEAPDVLYVDGFSQGRTALESREVADGAHAYDLLRAVALSPEDTAELIGDYMEGRTEP